MTNLGFVDIQCKGNEVSRHLTYLLECPGLGVVGVEAGYPGHPPLSFLEGLDADRW